MTPAKFGLGDGDALFVVFDGHGAKGHECSAFAKTKFPSLLASNIQKARASKNANRIKDNPELAKLPKAFHPSRWPLLQVEEYERCCRDACLRCNKAMHQDSEVSCTRSCVIEVKLCSIHQAYQLSHIQYP
jgi:serine/threonine protein phosphatase PrpC